MSAALDLGAFATLGLLGSLHCAGMCGGFSLAVGLGARGRRAFLARQASYLAGKATTYAIVCGVLAQAGALPGPTSTRIVALAAGLGLVLLGLVRLRPVGPPGWAPPGSLGLLRRALASARALPGPAGRFATGVVNGLVPCGLSGAAFLLAAGQPPHRAALGGFLFGAATAPALVLVALAPHLPRRLAAAGHPRFLGLVLIGFGALTLVRSSTSEAPGAACHDPASPGLARP